MWYFYTVCFSTTNKFRFDKKKVKLSGNKFVSWVFYWHPGFVFLKYSKSTKCPVFESVWNCANCLHKEPQNTNMWTLHVFRYVSHVHKRRACPPDLSHTHPHNYYRMSAGWSAGALNPPVRHISDYFDRKCVWFWWHILLQTKWRNPPPPQPESFVMCHATDEGLYLFISFYFVFFPPLEISCSFKEGNAQLRTYLQVYQPYVWAPAFIMLCVSDLFHSIFHEL